MEGDIFKKQRELIEEKKKSIKHGSSVVHLNYVGVFTKSDLKEISNCLITGNLELSSFDSSGIMMNSLEDFNFVAYLALSQPLIIEIIKGVGTNAIWDTFKQTVILTRKKILGKKISQITSQGTTEKNITFGIKVNLDKNTGFDFEIGGELSNELVNTCLDKVLDFMKVQTIKNEYEHPIYMKFSKKDKKWVQINVFEEIRKKNKQDR